MALADDLNESLYEVRGLIGDPELGLRKYTVTLLATGWDGGSTGKGLAVTEDTPITEGSGNPPDVVALNREQLAIGEFETGSLKVGPVTPYFKNGTVEGGTKLSELAGHALSTGDELHFKVTGPPWPEARLFKLVDFNADSALAYFLTLEPLGKSP